MFRMLFALSGLVIGVLIATPLLVPAPARAQDEPPPRSAAAALTAKVDQLFAPWNKPDSPGCLVGLIEDGVLVYQHGYGTANLDYGIPISPKSVFPIASLSKQFTAACVALMADDGAVSLDDDIRRYLPEMSDYGRPITVRHLIHHTSGIRDYGNELLPLTGMGPDEAATDDDVLQLLARQKGLNFLPDDAYRYSNSGYFLLGVIVKRITGMSLRAFARERLFEPLGMADTHFHDDPTQVVKDRVIGYFSDGDNAFQVRTPKNGSGDGGVMTTLKDLVTWDQACSGNHPGKEWKAGFVDRLLAPGKLNNGQPVKYAYGLNLGQYRGQKTVWHTGAFPGFRTALVRFPERRFAVIVLANLGGPKGVNAYQLALQVADFYLADALRPLPPEAPPKLEPTVTLSQQDLAGLEGKAGSFLDRDGAPWVLAVKDGSLHATVGAFSPTTYRTEALSPARFRSADPSFRFEIEFRGGGPGDLPAVRVRPPGEEAHPLQRVQLVWPTAAELRGYAGGFFSDELQATYRVELADGQLVLHARNAPDSPMKPTVRDVFKARRRNGNLTLRFVRAAGGEVSGFDLAQAGGARDFRFTRP